MFILLNTKLDFQTLLEIGFVPSALIVGGWIFAFILLLACIYYSFLSLFHSTKKK